MATDTVLWWLLGAVVFPAWLLAGAADHAWHVRTDIAHTSGRHESANAPAAACRDRHAVLAFLFLETDALTLAFLLAGVVAHTLSAWRDLRYAAHRRGIPPGEQMVHSLLFVLPWVAFALVAILHWPVVAALADPAIGSDWTLHARRPPFPVSVVVAVLAASALFGVLPGLWEFQRTNAVRVRAAQVSSRSARSATKPR